MPQAEMAGASLALRLRKYDDNARLHPWNETQIIFCDSTVTIILIQLSCEIAVNGSSEPVWLRGHPAQQVSAQAPSA
jgi:hypothetical protein